MCTARDGMWRDQKVCIKDQYRCDRVQHCSTPYEDENNCTQTVNSGCFSSRCNKAFRQPSGGHCGGEGDLMCTARDGRWAGSKICVKEKFLCDNFVQCEDGKDEEGCEEQYKMKRIFKRDHNYICRSPFLNITTEANETGKFFPMRAIRCRHYHHHF